MREQESQGGSDSSAQLAREPTVLSGDRDYNVPNFTCGTGVSECEALIAKTGRFPDRRRRVGPSPRRSRAQEPDHSVRLTFRGFPAGYHWELL